MSFSEEEGARGLFPDNEALMGKMLRLLEASAGAFSLSLVECVDRPARDQAIARLRKDHPGILLVGVGDGDPLASLPVEAPEAVFVLGLEDRVSSLNHEHPILRVLNAQREAWAKKVRCPVLFWLPPYVADAWMREAPDLWAVVSHRFRFEEGGERPDWPGISLPNTLAVLNPVEQEERRKEIEARIAEVGETPDQTLPSIERKAELATLSLLGGDAAKARSLTDEARAMVGSLGASAGRTSRALTSLAGVLQSLGDLAEARALMERALADDVRILGESHPDTTATRRNLELLLRELGSQHRARRHPGSSFYSDIRTFGEDYTRVAIGREILSSLLLDSQDYTSARPLLEETLASDLRELGPDHPAVALDRAGLANLLRLLGDLRGARELLEQALDVGVRTLGESHPWVGSWRSSLGRVLLDLGDALGAKRLLDHALALDLAALGSEHPRIAIERSNLSQALLSLGDPMGARAEGEEALRVARKLPAGSAIRVGIETTLLPLLGEWDFFLAHTSEDLPVARLLYAALSQRSRVFLDEACLLPGDAWDTRLPEAQGSSRVSVILVSRHTRGAWYEREEIASAVELAKRGGQRLVPVYLDDPETLEIPYGLRVRVPLRVATDGGIEGVAARLLELLSDLSMRSPLLGDPFDPWTPAVGTRFLGRRDILGVLEKALFEGRSVSLVGDARIGKTSILRTWAERARRLGREVRLLSGEEAEGASQGAFVAKVTGWQVAQDAGADEAAEGLDRWARAVTDKAGYPPLILVDEGDGLIGRVDHRFLERLRGMLGRVVLVIVSRRELDRIYKDLGRTSPFHNRLELCWVGLVEQEAATAIRGMAEAEDRDLLAGWAGCHPYFLALLGHHLAEARRMGEKQQKALDRAGAEAATRFRPLWTLLSEREREALRRTGRGESTRMRSLRVRGLVTEEGQVFGAALTEWLEEEGE